MIILIYDTRHFGCRLTPLLNRMLYPDTNRALHYTATHCNTLVTYFSSLLSFACVEWCARAPRAFVPTAPWHKSRARGDRGVCVCVRLHVGSNAALRPFFLLVNLCECGFVTYLYMEFGALSCCVTYSGISSLLPPCVWMRVWSSWLIHIHMEFVTQSCCVTHSGVSSLMPPCVPVCVWGSWLIHMTPSCRVTYSGV